MFEVYWKNQATDKWEVQDSPTFKTRSEANDWISEQMDGGLYTVKEILKTEAE